ncbi:MAG TPA: hypothetical protein PLY70_09315 [Saprospiraceae bacterium]|nr:hypothetical protein [Saprospiraceae bacterium]HPN69955.1 hypothetical protein [Saprospiraceae bacterium]
MIKKTTILLLLFALCSFTTGSAQKIPSFGISKEDTLKIYYNLNQNLKVKVNDADPTLIKIRCSESRGVSISQADTNFYIFVNNPVAEIKLKLYYKNLPVDIVNAKIERLPASDLKLEIAQNGEISKRKLAEVKKLMAEIPNNYKNDLNLAIYSYNINIIRKNGSVEIISCFNNTLTDQAIKKLLALPDDSQIAISNVRLKTPENNVIELEGEGLKYFIKY